MSEATVLSTLQAWLAKPVQVRVTLAGSPTSFAMDGVLMQDQSLPPGSLEGWYVDVRAARKDDIGFGTLDLGVEKYPERTLHDNGDAYPPRVVLGGAGPLEIVIDAATEDPG